ncbi:uncharacterized protein LOC144581639 [Callithrix jacchus]
MLQLHLSLPPPPVLREPRPKSEGDSVTSRLRRACALTHSLRPNSGSAAAGAGRRSCAARFPPLFPSVPRRLRCRRDVTKPGGRHYREPSSEPAGQRQPQQPPEVHEEPTAACACDPCAGGAAGAARSGSGLGRVASWTRRCLPRSWIEQLNECKQLSESQVKSLCEKAQLSQALEELGSQKQRSDTLEMELKMLKSQVSSSEQSFLFSREEVDMLSFRLYLNCTTGRVSSTCTSPTPFLWPPTQLEGHNIFSTLSP